MGLLLKTVSHFNQQMASWSKCSGLFHLRFPFHCRKFSYRGVGWGQGHCASRSHFLFKLEVHYHLLFCSIESPLNTDSGVHIPLATCCISTGNEPPGLQIGKVGLYVKSVSIVYFFYFIFLFFFFTGMFFKHNKKNIYLNNKQTLLLLNTPHRNPKQYMLTRRK